VGSNKLYPNCRYKIEKGKRINYASTFGEPTPNSVYSNIIIAAGIQIAMLRQYETYLLTDL